MGRKLVCKLNKDDYFKVKGIVFLIGRLYLVNLMLVVSWGVFGNEEKVYEFM